MPAENVLTEWSFLLLRSFADAGVRDVVISPGSRSTPLVVAAVREPRLRLHNIVDERAAAFFALGQARVTQRPSLLLCTSGTAAAHYLPAIIEAQATFVPMLVLTADRPPELQGCAASQTIDQVKLFGSYTNEFFDLGTAEPTAASFNAIRRMAAQARSRTLWPTPGVTHLNARIRKPLEPVVASTPEEHAVVALGRAAAALPIVRPLGAMGAPTREELADVAALCASTTRGLIACGPGDVRQVAAREAIFDLARVTGFPILADATSQLRFTAIPSDVVVVDALETLVGAGWLTGERRPEVIVQVGAPLVSSAWENVLGGMGQRIVVAEHGWSDPQSRAFALVLGPVDKTIRALADALEGRAPSLEWARHVADANTRAWQAITETLDTSPELTEGHVARVIAGIVPAGSSWMLGNSLAARVVNDCCPSSACDVTMLSQRGAAGIDGLIAGAAGAATQTDQPVTLLLGDVSFLHDLTSLAWARRATVPLVIVIVNNGGGRIFEQLPLASVPDLEPEILAQTVTPHTFALEHAGKLFDVRWEKVSDEASLRAALRGAYASNGCTVVEALVAPHGNAARSRLTKSRVTERLGW